jgi:cyanate permease
MYRMPTGKTELMNTVNTKPSSALARPFPLLTGILLIATNLRAPITGVAPVLEMIRDATGLSTAGAGTLTTLPLLASPLRRPSVCCWGVSTGWSAACSWPCC